MQPTATLKQVIREFRQMLPAETATARAIDRGAPWELIAISAIDDGYLDGADELEKFIEVCLRETNHFAVSAPQ
jgi:hypothetical protein